MRGMKIRGQGRSKPKRIASSGRNVEGGTYLVVDVGGERQLRCKFCHALMPIAKRWEHVCQNNGTS
jgi:hypothetical protein